MQGRKKRHTVILTSTPEKEKLIHEQRASAKRQKSALKAPQVTTKG